MGFFTCRVLPCGAPPLGAFHSGIGGFVVASILPGVPFLAAPR
jgi:hypothetical protein